MHMMIFLFVVKEAIWDLGGTSSREPKKEATKGTDDDRREIQRGHARCEVTGVSTTRKPKAIKVPNQPRMRWSQEIQVDEGREDVLAVISVVAIHLIFDEISDIATEINSLIIKIFWSVIDEVVDFDTCCGTNLLSGDLFSRTFRERVRTGNGERGTRGGGSTCREP